MRPGAARATRDGGARDARSDLNRVGTASRARRRRATTRARDARRAMGGARASRPDGARARATATARGTRTDVLEISSGEPAPLGPTATTSGGINFATYSESASEVSLCVYDESDDWSEATPRWEVPMTRTGNVWHARVERLSLIHI